MIIRIEKPFSDFETTLSPIPFYKDEILNVPDAIAQKIIERGHAVRMEVTVLTATQSATNAARRLAASTPKKQSKKRSH